MSLQPGTRLGAYEILRLLGAGGMGEVFRARDTKLDREVAIKVLSDSFAEDMERVARFEREAKLLAQLNHPGIATLYGFEDVSGRRLLTMELVEGETLRDRIARGPIPWEEAAPLFLQIAEALEAAHDKGILHRDLKPANVKIGAGDRAKILDFGLAKVVEGTPRSSSEDVSHSPTLTKETALGVILGTASYMSPEQARGKPLDGRTDVWAFGCCLYEALTGLRAFEGETVTDTLAAVVKSPPDFGKLPPRTPVPLRRLLKRALEKDPARRIRDAGGLRFELEEALSGGKEAESPPAQKPRRWKAWVIAAASLAAFAGAGVARFLPSAPSDAAPVRRLSIVIPPDQELDVGPFYYLALSPDGSKLVYPASDASGTSRLYLRRLDEFETAPIPGTEGATSPFFSPDGTSIGFHAAGMLNKISLEGGAPVALAPAPSGFHGASWAEDDTITMDTAWAAQGLMTVYPTGDVQPLSVRSEGDEPSPAVRSPHALPGGTRFLCEGFFGLANHLGVVDRGTGHWRSVLRGGTFLSRARYLEPGYIVYAELSSGSLLAVEFDVSGGVARGTPSKVVDQILGNVDGMHFDVSANGTLAYVPAGASGYANRPVWVDRDGRVAPAGIEGDSFGDPRVSPDGYWLAATDDTGRTWIYDLRTGGRRHFFQELVGQPVWSPDGQEILFTRLFAQEPGLWRKPAFGAGEAQKVVEREYMSWAINWARDGTIGFYQQHPVTGRDVWVQTPGEEPVLVAGTRANERSPWFSPDGRFLAYVSDESGRPSVYVEPFPSTGEKWLVSPDGGEEPVWSRDGRELFYRRGRAMMSVPVEGSASFSFGAPRVLFEGSFEVATGGRNQNFDVAPDGRFLMIQRLDPESPREIRVVLDWTEELKRLLPRTR